MNHSRRFLPLIFVSLGVWSGAAFGQAAETETHSAPWPGIKDSWHGHDRYTFRLDDRLCYVVVPSRPAPGRPWIWRARFWGHEPQVDLALLDKGFHVVHIDVSHLFGSPQAEAIWDKFYAKLTGEHGLAPKAVLEGMSRGGLMVYNWASAHPDRVASIYADAPVCDFKSWPGGKGKGPGSPADWKNCLAAYGLSEEEALRYRHNPIDNLASLAKAGVPLLHVCGDADRVVPMDENTRVLQKRYLQLGGSITVIAKPGVGHHPHSLKNPEPIVEFILKHAR